MAVDLTTLDEVKAFANIKGATDDALLASMIAGSSAFVENYLGRRLTRDTYTRLFDGMGGDQIVLPEYPVATVTAVSVDGVAIPQAASSQDRGFHHDDLTIWLRGWWFTRGRRNVSVTWEAGHEEVPEDVSRAVAELVTLAFKERDRIGLVSKGIAGESTSYFQGYMTPRIRSVLSQHRKVIPW